jgi:hypothetical protein
MRTARFLRFAIPAAGVLLLAAGAVAVSASATGLSLGSLEAATSPSTSAATTAAGVPVAFGRGSVRAGAIRAYLSAAATALGVSDRRLLGDLKSGRTLSQVAAAQGVSEDQFKTSVVATLKPKLDAAVADHRITQAQEDRILARLQNGDPPLWNRTPRSGG